MIQSLEIMQVDNISDGFVYKQKSKTREGRRSKQRGRRRPFTIRLVKQKNPRPANNNGPDFMVHNHRIGQQPTNQIYYKQRFTNNANIGRR